MRIFLGVIFFAYTSVFGFLNAETQCARIDPQKLVEKLSSLYAKEKGDGLLILKELAKIDPLAADWLNQDFVADFGFMGKSDAQKTDIFNGLSKKYGGEKGKDLIDALAKYFCAREKNRKKFLAEFVLKKFPLTYIYVENYGLSPSFYGYTEGLSDARGESHFRPDSKLCILKIDPNSFEISRTVLLESKEGTIRDPDVSYDGKKILFAWKKNRNNDDYSLYEMDAATREIRLITKSDKQADFEGKYLPTGEIIFNSTRCEQTVSCYNVEVSNLYIARPDGTALRRVGFDQVHTTYPTVRENGDIIYTRWDYNDRGQIFTQGVFEMKPDGSFQRELYGNKSWCPTAIGHTRQIPNQANKYVCILHGHHTPQHGHLAIFDTDKGTQECAGMQELAPRRKPSLQRRDDYAQDGPQFKYPYPLSDKLFLVSANFLSAKWNAHPSSKELRRLPFGLYLIDADGKRELLTPQYIAQDSVQIVPLCERKIPNIEKSRLDYSNMTGYCMIRNIYSGHGTAGVKKGEIEKVRIIKLHYRRAPVGKMEIVGNEGAGSGTCYTPVALGNGTWDVKEILGEVPVSDDGSVYFEVPARTPIYFQPIDKNGCAVNTMRSWTTMQPNEFYSCLGCHGNKNENDIARVEIDNARKPLKISPFYDIRGGFSFRKIVQPILNKHCIGCHNDRNSKILISGNDFKTKISVADLAEVKSEEMANFIKQNKANKNRSFSLLDVPIPNEMAKRYFNDAYYNLLRPSKPNGGKFPYIVECESELVNWLGAQNAPVLQKPYKRGAATSKLFKMLKDEHKNVKLSKEELDKIAAWIDLYVPFCGDYLESGLWSDKEKAFYKYYEDKAKRAEREEKENIQKYLIKR